MNNAQLIAIAVPFVILLGAIVAGAWLNQRGLERQMDAFRSEIKAVMGEFKSEIRLELITEITPLRADVVQVRADVEQVKKSVERIERQLHTDVEQVKKTVEKIERQLEAIFSRLIVPK